MISVQISVQTKDGGEKPTPTVHINAERWSGEVVAELLAVLCERAGAIGGVGLLPARIQQVEEGRLRFTVMTEKDTAFSEPLVVPVEAMEASGFPIGNKFDLQVRPYRFSSIDVLDLHFPVFAGRRVANDQLAPASPYIYGTAFPIWHGGLFATAAHVVKSAASMGEVVLGRLGGKGPAIPGFGIERAELFEDFDFALLKCPGLEKFPPITIEMQQSLTLFDEVKAIGYPFSVDPEHLVATHRGFAGHVVASRQLYRLPGQPFGYEVSFPTPPGMSGAPLMHRGPDGVFRCYGVIVEQATTELGGVSVSLGIAISSKVLRSIKSQFLRADSFSEWFGVAATPPPLRHDARVLRTKASIDDDLQGWPDAEE